VCHNVSQCQNFLQSYCKNKMVQFFGDSVEIISCKLSAFKDIVVIWDRTNWDFTLEQLST